MEVTQIFLAFIDNLSRSPIDNEAIERKKPSNFLIKAHSINDRVSSFDRLLCHVHDNFIGLHRYLPRKYLSGGNISTFTEKDRKDMLDEVVKFMNATALAIQDLTNDLDELIGTISVPLIHFYQQVISQLLHKLNSFSRHWDSLQKEFRVNNISPCRLFSRYYEENESSDKENRSQQLDLKPLKKPSSGRADIAGAANRIIQKEESNFAQRYVDEIGPPAKLQQYESIASKQKDILVQEARSLRKRFSEDILQSQRLESTILNITSLVNDFASMLEDQSGTVENIGEVAKEVKESVKQADRELVVTLERTKSQQLNMTIFIVALSLLLLTLHIITP